jgi:hypothetical protein
MAMSDLPVVRRVARISNHCAGDACRRHACRDRRERKDHAMTTPAIDEAQLARIIIVNGINLTPDQVRSILPGALMLMGVAHRVMKSCGDDNRGNGLFR